MKTFLIQLLAALILLGGCSNESIEAPPELSGFIEKLRENGLQGSLYIRRPANEELEYVAEYTLARYASTRIVSLFRFRNTEQLAARLQEAMHNDRLSGQASNGRFLLAASFYPPDQAAVEKIRALFLAYEFE